MQNEKLHSTLGASHSHRWLRCPGSVALSKKAPPQPESDAANEGTEAHELLERCLLAFKKNKKTVHLTEPKFDDNVLRAIEYILSGYHVPSCELLVEDKIDLSFIDPELFGTLDCAIVEPWGTLEIIDYKHGRGLVEVEENTQLIYYALGVAHKYDYDFQDVKMTIIQPRAEHPDGPIRSWTISIEKLKGYIDLFTKGVARTRQANAKLFAGDHCKYCPASVICPEISKKALTEAQLEFEDISVEDPKKKLPSPQHLKPDQISKILIASESLDSWINDVRNYAEFFLNEGGYIPGYQLVPKRGQRRWKDPKLVAKQLNGKVKSIYSPQELLTPAQMEKQKPIKKGVDIKSIVDKLSVSVSSGMTLAKAKTDFSELKQIGENKNAKRTARR